MKPSAVGLVLVLLSAGGVVVLRLKRGWETWGDLVSFSLAAGLCVGSLNTAEADSDPVLAGIFGGLYGTWMYWLYRPATEPPVPDLHPTTEEQHRLLARMSLAYTTLVVVGFAAHLGLGLLYAFRRLAAMWLVVAYAILAVLWAIASRLKRALKESGPPFHELRRHPLPGRW